eukprot:2790578-Rhodomonas_salina.4
MDRDIGGDRKANAYKSGVASRMHRTRGGIVPQCAESSTPLQRTADCCGTGEGIQSSESRRTRNGRGEGGNEETRVSARSWPNLLLDANQIHASARKESGGGGVQGRSTRQGRGRGRGRGTQHE